MKKGLLFLFVAVATLACGCDNVPTDENLIFSEFYIGEISSDKAVEIANVGDKAINLSNYSICTYRNFTGQDKPTDVVQLSGTLEPNNVYVVTYSLSSNEIKEKANLISEKMIGNGYFSMSLKYKNKYIVDSIGSVGYCADYAQYSDLVRKKEYLLQRGSTYEAYDWIRYPNGDSSHLGNLDCMSEYELLLGPKLTQEDLDKPYCTNDSTGNGGTLQVTLSYCIDGDTTKFNFGSKYSSYGVSGVNSIRYYGINTPEVAHYGSSADPYGDEAKAFTNNIINGAKKFICQSITDYSLFETYGRLLGYVWTSDINNPSPNDYTLLSYAIVLAGLARVGFVDRGQSYFNKMLYKGISYIEYLYDAMNFAQKYNLKIFSGN